MRSFYILNHRASAPGTPASNGVVARATGRRERLRYRDIVWAFHSESQELLLGACTSACNGKMCWSDARALGVSIWLNSGESMVSLALYWMSQTVLFTRLAEISHGSYSSERVHGRGSPRSHCMFSVLLCARKGQASTWPVEASSLAQGARTYAQVPVQRFHRTSMANGGSEECLRTSQQTSVW